MECDWYKRNNENERHNLYPLSQIKVSCIKPPRDKILKMCILHEITSIHEFDTKSGLMLSLCVEHVTSQFECACWELFNAKCPAKNTDR